ncbi:MAG: hypothetical protein EZS28_033375 [Streblomastix strix]|uniref:Uncharacterized protein n=1 Tax=Streblomastix strix TaxID=222440 RepID=A0A5J4UL21_9EUKA|nr:MAG: hypothetical protein EZS28_033375 [Streblomastix strix]
MPPAADTINTPERARAAVNFGADENIGLAAADMIQSTQHYAEDEILRFWLGFSTTCGPFNQFAICKGSTKLWDTSIYAREQAVICSNSLNDLCVNNSVSVSPLESIIAGKRHCGVFIDLPLGLVNTSTATIRKYYLIPDDIIFSGDFLKDLKVVWLNKTDTVANRHLAYQMIPPEKPNIIYLMTSPLNPKPL